MKEPTRLLIQGATEAERPLLRSASTDGPPPGAVQRMMSALDGLPAGNGEPGSPGPGPESGGALTRAHLAARSAKVASLAKIGLVALLGVAGLVTGVMVHGRTGSQPAPSETPPAQASQEAAPVPAKPTLAAANDSRALPPSRETDPSDDSLSAELRILDETRAALDARHASEARRALDDYAQRFPHGLLKPEATVLRLEVLMRQGDLAAARSLGQTLLANEAYRTYAPRIRSLLREMRKE